jgi:hypothetical protein
VFTIISDIIKSRLFVFVAMLGVYFTEFYINKYTYDAFWVPIQDLMQCVDILMLNASLPNLMLGFGRNILLALVLYMVSKEIFLRRDILSNEK